MCVCVCIFLCVCVHMCVCGGICGVIAIAI